MGQPLIDELFGRAVAHFISARDLVEVARLDAATLNHYDLDKAAFNGRNSPSIHLLIGYSAELFLKVAYLINGGDAKFLKRNNNKGIGHNLVRALDYAEEVGFKTNAKNLRWVVERLNPMHEHHRFRYGGTDYIEMPSLEVSFGVLEALMRELIPNTFLRR